MCPMESNSFHHGINRPRRSGDGPNFRALLDSARLQAPPGAGIGRLCVRCPESDQQAPPERGSARCGVSKAGAIGAGPAGAGSATITPVVILVPAVLPRMGGEAGKPDSLTARAFGLSRTLVGVTFFRRRWLRPWSGLVGLNGLTGGPGCPCGRNRRRFLWVP